MPFRFSFPWATAGLSAAALIVFAFTHLREDPLGARALGDVLSAWRETPWLRLPGEFLDELGPSTLDDIALASAAAERPVPVDDFDAAQHALDLRAHAALLEFRSRPAHRLALHLDRGVQPGLLTYPFTHASGAHLGFNLLFLVLAAPWLERAWRAWRFLAFFAAAAWVSAGAEYWRTAAGAAPVLMGASGAVAALIGAVLSLQLVAAFRAPDATRFSLSSGARLLPALAWLGALLASRGQPSSSQVATAAHLAGFCFGLLAPLVAGAVRAALSGTPDRLPLRTEN